MAFHISFCTLLMLFFPPILGQMTLGSPATAATEKTDDASPQAGGINLGNSFFLRDLSQDISDCVFRTRTECAEYMDGSDARTDSTRRSVSQRDNGTHRTFGNRQTILDFSRFGGHLPTGILREALLQEWQRSFRNPPIRTGSNAGRGWGVRISSPKDNGSTATQPQSSNNETQILSHDATENSSNWPFSSNQTRNRVSINDIHRNTEISSSTQRITEEFQRNSGFRTSGISNIPSNDGWGLSGRPSSNTQNNNTGFPRSAIVDIFGRRISDSRGQGDVVNSGTSFSGSISLPPSPIQFSKVLWNTNMNNGTFPNTDSVLHSNFPSGQDLNNDSSMPGSRLPISERGDNSKMHKDLSFSELFASLFGESATEVPTPLGERKNGQSNFLDDWNNTQHSNSNTLPGESGVAVPQWFWSSFQGSIPSSLEISDQSSSGNFQQTLAKDSLGPALVDTNAAINETQKLQQKHFLGFPGNNSNIVFAGGQRIIPTSSNSFASSKQLLFSINQNQQNMFDSSVPLIVRNKEMQLFDNISSNIDNNVNTGSIKDIYIGSGPTGLQNLDTKNVGTIMDFERLPLNQTLVSLPIMHVVKEGSNPLLNKGRTGPIQSLVQTQHGGLNFITSTESTYMEMTTLKSIPAKPIETFGPRRIKDQSTIIRDNKESAIKTEPVTLPIPNERSFTILPIDQNIGNINDNQFHSKEPIVNSLSQILKRGKQSNSLGKATVETKDDVLLSRASTSIPTLFDSTVKNMVHILQTKGRNPFKKPQQLLSMNTQPPIDSSKALFLMTRPSSQVVKKAMTRKGTIGEIKLSTMGAANVMKEFPTFVNVNQPSLQVPNENVLQVPDVRTTVFIRQAFSHVTNLKNNSNLFNIKTISLNPNRPQSLPKGFQLIQGSWSNGNATNEAERNGKEMNMHRFKSAIPSTHARNTGNRVDMQPSRLSPPVKMMKQSSVMLKVPVSSGYMTTPPCD